VLHEREPNLVGSVAVAVVSAIDCFPSTVALVRDAKSRDVIGPFGSRGVRELAGEIAGTGAQEADREGGLRGWVAIARSEKGFGDLAGRRDGGRHGRPQVLW